MEEKAILGLYFAREEQAIRETDRKFGNLCRRIAWNILGCREDVEECVNDTWLAVWNRIPPERPDCLGAYLGRIVRNLAVSRYRENHAQKRYGPMEVLLSELEECIPDRNTHAKEGAAFDCRTLCVLRIRLFRAKLVSCYHYISDFAIFQAYLSSIGVLRALKWARNKFGIVLSGIV